MNAFRNQKRIFTSERTLIPRKTPEKIEIEARKFMLRSPNHAAISTMISTIVLLRVRSYSESTKVRFALCVPFFCSVLLTHSCTFPEVHIEKGNVIVQSIVSLRQLLYVILTMSLNHTTPLRQESSLFKSKPWSLTSSDASHVVRYCEFSRAPVHICHPLQPWCQVQSIVEAAERI